MTYLVWVKEKPKSGWEQVAEEPDAEAAWRAFKAWLKSRGREVLPLASAVLPLGVHPQRRET